MRNLARAPWLLAGVLGLAASALGQPAASPLTPVPGTWRLDFNRKDALLVLTRDKAGKKGPDSDDTPAIRQENCLGLKRPSGAANVPVQFQVYRDSGTIAFEGQANETSGAGSFVLTPSETFIEQIPDVTAEHLYKIVVYDVSTEFIRDIQAMGYRPHPPPDQLVALRMSGINGEYVGELKRHGYEAVSVKDLIRLRKGGVTAEFLYGLKRKGVGRLSVDELIKRASKAGKKS